MAYELIPGVRQDHRGKLYQFGRYPNGKLIEIAVEPLPLSAKTQAQLERVSVESQTKPGTFYESLACFQGATI